jgi:hypothetical protein
MNRSIKNLGLTLCIWVVTEAGSWAQCAMCKASVENNISEGSAGLAAGLNTGILYLFVAPYLMVTLIGLLWYWKSKAHNARTVQYKGHP